MSASFYEIASTVSRLGGHLPVEWPNYVIYLNPLGKPGARSFVSASSLSRIRCWRYTHNMERATRRARMQHINDHRHGKQSSERASEPRARGDRECAGNWPMGDRRRG